MGNSPSYLCAVNGKADCLKYLNRLQIKGTNECALEKKYRPFFKAT